MRASQTRLAKTLKQTDDDLDVLQLVMLPIFIVAKTSLTPGAIQNVKILSYISKTKYFFLCDIGDDRITMSKGCSPNSICCR